MNKKVTWLIVIASALLLGPTSWAFADEKPKKEICTIRVIKIVDADGKEKIDTLKSTVCFDEVTSKIMALKMDSLCQFNMKDIDLEKLKGLQEFNMDSTWGKDIKVALKSFNDKWNDKGMKKIFEHFDSRAAYWVDETDPSILSIEKEKMKGGKEKITIIRKLPEKK